MHNNMHVCTKSVPPKSCSKLGPCISFLSLKGILLESPGMMSHIPGWEPQHLATTKGIYYYLKSWPHWETQWASSTTNREMRAFICIIFIRSKNFEVAACSGVIYKSRHLGFSLFRSDMILPCSIWRYIQNETIRSVNLGKT